MKRPLLAVLVAGLAACAHAPARRTVIVEGWASSGADADRRAVGDALKRAVEESGGVRVDARTRVANGVGTDSRVVTRAGGCVLEHEVLRRSDESGGRGARVRVVLSSSGEECAGKTALPPAALSDSTVSVSFRGEGAYGREAARAAETALRGELSAQGVVVLSSGADYRITGTATVSRHLDARVAPFVGARVEMTVRVVSARDGRVARETFHGASALGADGGAAAVRAASDAARSAVHDSLVALDDGYWMHP